jgi:hypothetical protein
MERTVSTALTPLWKFLFPVYFVGLATLYTHDAIVHPERVGGRSWVTVLSGIGMWILAAAVIPPAARLRRVRMDDAGLTVSNYIRQIRVPWSAITHITVERSRRSTSVTVCFRDDTLLGRRATFIPPQFKNHEKLVAEMRERAGLGMGVEVGAAVAHLRP